jgi:hypothetical protein
MSRLIDSKPWIPFNLVEPCEDGDAVSLTTDVRSMQLAERDAVLDARAALLKMICSGRRDALGLRLIGRLS